MRKVMFLCTANSCRSQMAEGLARDLGKGIIEPYSSGLFAAYVHPRAIRAMKEIGIDISGHRSKEMDPSELKKMDVIITLCGHAETSCPQTPVNIRRLHWPVADPVGTVGTEEEIQEAFRNARDEIREKIQGFIRDIRAGGQAKD